MRALLRAGTPKGLTRRLAAACGRLIGAARALQAIGRVMSRALAIIERLITNDGDRLGAAIAA